MYIPWGLPSVTDSGSRVATGFRDVIAGRAATLLNILTGDTSTDGAFGWPVIASSKDQAWNRITAIAVGDVVDVQRRRKNRLKENYITNEWTAPEP
jgi:hypothetical protein